MINVGVFPHRVLSEERSWGPVFYPPGVSGTLALKHRECHDGSYSSEKSSKRSFYRVQKKRCPTEIFWSTFHPIVL